MAIENAQLRELQNVLLEIRDELRELHKDLEPIIAVPQPIMVDPTKLSGLEVKWDRRGYNAKS